MKYLIKTTPIHSAKLWNIRSFISPLPYLLAIVLLTLTDANAQVIKGWGLKGGVTKANQHWVFSEIQYQPDWHDEIGGTVGLFAEFVDHKIFGLGAEVAFTQKGMQDKQPVTTSGPEPTGAFIIQDNGLDYLSLSLYGKLQAGEKSILPYVLTGPRLDVLLNKRNAPFYDDVYAGLKNTVFGLSVGVGAELRTRLAFAVLAEVRYNRDLSPSLDLDTLTIKNESFDFRLGLKF